MNKQKASQQIWNHKKATLFLVTILVFLCAFYISTNWFQLMLIQGNSMEPTYHHLQLVILDKRFNAYCAGDVIAFQCDELQSVIVKRIAAIPGDKVIIQDHLLLVNDRPTSFYADRVFSNGGILENEIMLEDGQYIVIGDNILESVDSRDKRVGIVEEKFILGKVR